MLKKNGEWILVNENYQLFYSTSEYEIVNIYNDVLCIQSRENSTYGLMDIYGNIFVFPQYDSPIVFSEGLALVERGGKMKRRTKILVLCENDSESRDEFLEWQQVLKDEIAAGVKCNFEARRIETPFCIMDFVDTKPIFCKEYQYILPENCESESVLAIAIGDNL